MSAESQTPVDEMTREELKERVIELEEDVENLEGVGTVVAMLVNQLRDTDVDERITWDDDEFIPIAAKTFKKHIQEFEDVQNTTKRVDSTVKERKGAMTPDGENWQSVVEKAHELKRDSNHGLPANRVKLYRDQIAHACDVGKKRGQQLISEWADPNHPAYEKKGKRGVEFQPYQEGTPGNNNEKQRKALIVDLDVWEVGE